MDPNKLLIECKKAGCEQDIECISQMCVLLQTMLSEYCIESEIIKIAITEFLHLVEIKKFNAMISEFSSETTKLNYDISTHFCNITNMINENKILNLSDKSILFIKLNTVLRNMSKISPNEISKTAELIIEELDGVANTMEKSDVNTKFIEYRKKIEEMGESIISTNEKTIILKKIDNYLETN
jgi:hypothetical protein